MRPGGGPRSGDRQTSSRPRGRAGAARLARGGPRAGPVRDRARPRPRGARVPVRGPAGDHLHRGRAGHRAPRGRRARGRHHRARDRLAGRDRRARGRQDGARRIRSLPQRPRSAVSKQRQRELLAEAGVPQPRWQLVRMAEEGLPVPAVVKAPDRQGQKGLTLVRSEEELPGAIARGDRGVAERSRARRGGRGRARGDRERVLPARRVPPADRHRPADRGAARVRRRARARLAERGGREGRGGRRVRGEGPRNRGRPDLHAASRRPGRPAGDRGRSATGRRPRRGAREARAGRRPQRPRAPGRARRVDLVGRAPSEPAGRRRDRPLPRPAGGRAAGSRGSRARPARSKASRTSAIYRVPGHVFGPFRRGADRAGAVLAVGDSREEALERADEAARLIRFKVGAESLV